MLNPSQIVRFIDNQDFRRLIDRVLANGRCHSRVAQAALHNQDALMPAALGLGLQRICELAYWPLPDGADLAHRMLRTQRRDGLFGPVQGDANASNLIAATAVALRGLIDWAAQFQQCADEQSLIHRSIERGLAALNVEFATSAADHTAWAVILWQLGDCDLACERLPMRKIRQRLVASAPEFLADDLTRLALTMAA